MMMVFFEPAKTNENLLNMIYIYIYNWFINDRKVIFAKSYLVRGAGFP